MITRNFSWAEMQASATARRKGFDNTIPASLRPNMINLCTNVLQPIRDAYGKPIIVGSGYRCPKLNKAVGGVSNSQHMTASAADIHSLSDRLSDNRELWDIIITLANAGRIHCRQIIWEYGTLTGPDWIHIAINDAIHSHRENQILTIER
ncbi:MAG: peptidase M15 [Bacteroidaceae bacterium]|nr:peptidase M15 [Bacteroidaceae bacterium]